MHIYFFQEQFQVIKSFQQIMALFLPKKKEKKVIYELIKIQKQY